MIVACKKRVSEKHGKSVDIHTFIEFIHGFL